MNGLNALYHMELEEFNWTLSASSLANNEWQVDSATTEALDHPPARYPPLNIPYTIFEILVALIAVVGNAMVIYVFRIERKLRRRTNYYIVSLAIADLFVGLFGIPFAILAAIGLPTNLHACLFTISLLVVLCTISIFCLVAVSIDRYWAILHPMAYSRNVRTRTAIVIIAACWFAGILIGLLPLFGWHAPQNGPTVCLFVKVMSYDYLVFLYFGTIVTPAILLIAFYAHIYRVIVRQLRQIVTMNPTGTATSSNSSHIPNPGATPATGMPSNNSTSTNIVTGFVQQLSRRSSRKSITPTNNSGNQSNGANTPEVSPRTQSPFSFGGGTANSPHPAQGGTMLRVLGAAQKREVKATQNLSIIVLFFMICWLPLYTVNCVKAFCQDCEINSALMLALIALSHVNSAVNPLLYAYHLRDFRAALKNLILRMMGREVPRTTTDLHRRISAASRMQSMREQKRSFHPRIYIDSPVWMRQQQAQQMGGSNHQHSKAVMVGVNRALSMGSALRSVVRVASTPTDPTTPEVMSQIAEVPSHAERESSKNLNEGSFGQLSNCRAAGQFSKKSSQSSNLARSSNHQSFDCYMSDGRGVDGDDDDDEDVDEGIKIVIHKERKVKSNGVKNNNNNNNKNVNNSKDVDNNNYSIANYSSENISNSKDKRRRRRGRRESTTGSSSDDGDEEFVTSTSSPDPNQSESISYVVANYGGEQQTKPQHQEIVLHSTDLPTFHHHLNLDERSFYEAFKRRRRPPRPRPLGRSDSTCSLERRTATTPTLEDDTTKYSSTGTISSEDLTEFRDRSASSVFIIENDTVQLSPRHEKTEEGSANSSLRRGHLQKQHRRRSSNKDILMKHSPLKGVTQLIFASNCEATATSGGVSGIFNYVDMEDEQQSKSTPKKRKSLPSSGGKFLRSVSDS